MDQGLPLREALGMTPTGYAATHYGHTPQWGRPHYIYRHYDATGRLLYVGCTSNPDKRPYVRAGRSWMGDSAKVVVDGPYEWVEALEIEECSIRSGNPLHNKRQANGSWIRRYVVERERAIINGEPIPQMSENLNRAIVKAMFAGQLRGVRI